MRPFSRLSKAEQRDWRERADKALARYGVRRSQFITLCDASLILHRWNEEECNGTIQREEPTNRWPLGRPRRFFEDKEGRLIELGHIPDRAAGAMRRAKQALIEHPDLMPYWFDDPRGCAVSFYSRTECLERGGNIDSCSSSICVPCYY